MLATLRKGDPVQEARARRQAEASRARDAVRQIEKKLKQLRQDRAAHERHVEAVRREVEQRGHPTTLGTYPSLAEARDRAERTAHLDQQVGAAERRLQAAERRARDAEARARPLSEGARARLVELADALEADRELAERGIDVPQLLATPAGRTRLLELAREEYGLGGGR